MFLFHRHPASLLRSFNPTMAYVFEDPEGASVLRTLLDTPAQCHAPATRCSESVSSYLHTTEKPDCFLLYADLPGIRKEDISVKLTTNGALHIHGEGKTGRAREVSKTYDRTLLLDNHIIDPTKISATFSDGMLEIVVPKQEATTARFVTVTSGPSPVSKEGEEGSSNEELLNVEVEIPGVKADAISVHVNGENVTIEGVRHRGGQATRIRRVLTVNPRTVDTSNLQAYLEDGILTLVASPIVQNDPCTIIIRNRSDDVNSPEESGGGSLTATEDPPVETTETALEKDADEMEFQVVPETVTEKDQD